MFLGTMYSGTRQEFNGQSIQTKFLVIGVPLLPTGTIYKVTPNQGFPMGLSLRSTMLGYFRTTFLALSILTFWIRSIDSNIIDEYPPFYHYSKYAAIIMFILSIVSWLKYLIDTSKENKTREILGRTIDYNMNPKHLNQNIAGSIYMKALEKYKEMFDKEEWELEVENGRINDDNKDILFTLAIYANSLLPNERHLNIYQIMCNFLNVKIND